jgi:hypothetical protein
MIVIVFEFQEETWKIVASKELVYVLVKHDNILRNNIIVRIPRLTVPDLRGSIRQKLIEGIYASDTASCLSWGFMGVSPSFDQHKQPNRGLSSFRSFM